MVAPPRSARRVWHHGPRATVKQALDCGTVLLRPRAPLRMRQADFFFPIALVATALACAAGAAATAPAPRPPATPASGPGTLLADACPAQLPVSQTITSPIAGWTLLNQQDNHPFTRVAFYPGPPAETALIVPTLEYKGQAGLHDGWDLPPRAGGYWMTCAYGNTSAMVARKLADNVDYCQADYDGRFLTLVVRHWSCGVKRTMGLPARAHPGPRSPPHTLPKR